MPVEIVGRAAELRTLEGFLDRVPEGSVAVVIEGEAGIGKTTLWGAALAFARDRDLLVLEARPAESETTLPLAAVGDLLEGVREEALAPLSEAQRRALEAALLLGEAVGPPDRRTLAVAFLNAVRALAAERPVLLSVDDVQWLDADSGSVLAYAVRRIRDAPIGLLVTLRAEADGGAPLGLERALADGGLTRLVVEPLDSGALHLVLRARLGLSLPLPVMREVADTAGGNPFFALELGRALQREGAVRKPGERLPVPATLAELVQDRLATLPERTVAAVSAIAALTQPALELALAAGGGDDVLAPAFAAHVLEVDGDRIRFAHPLLASGAYGAADAATRRELHSRLADLVEEPEERARHLALAADGPDAAVANALDEAAHRARSRGAAAAAAQLCEQAAGLTPTSSVAARHHRLLAAARYHFESGNGTRARALLDDLTSVPAGVERARALVLLGWVRSLDDDLRAARALFEQALAEADDDTKVLAEAHQGVASCSYRLRERLEEAVSHARAAVELRRSGAGDAFLEALGFQLLAEALNGRAEARATLTEVRSQQATDGRAQLPFQAGAAAAVCWMWWDEPRRAIATFEEHLDRAQRLGGDESVEPYLLVLLGQAACLLADFGAAARHAAEGLELAEQTGQGTMVAYLLALRGFVAANTDPDEASRSDAERAVELGRRTAGRPAEVLARWALGLGALALGQPEDAAGHLVPLVRLAQAEGVAEPGAARFVTDAVEALVATGQEAAEILDWYEANARRLGRRSALANVERCRGLLAAEEGDLERARAHLGRALTQHEHLPMPVDRARTLLALGATLRRANRKRDARETLTHALVEFERVGAGVWAGRAYQELGRISGRAPAKDRLTPIEERTALLVADGRPNREVASLLFLSERTVEGHLSRVYAKLGIHSRHELAKALARPISE